MKTKPGYPLGSGHEVDPVIRQSTGPTIEQLYRIIESYENLLEGIRAALDTEETGSNLIEVARDACHAERKLAALEHKLAKEAYESELDNNTD
jgi:hypothetical protein